MATGKRPDLIGGRAVLVAVRMGNRALKEVDHGLHRAGDDRMGRKLAAEIRGLGMPAPPSARDLPV
jgi:hypothetical protein